MLLPVYVGEILQMKSDKKCEFGDCNCEVVH